MGFTKHFYMSVSEILDLTVRLYKKSALKHILACLIWSTIGFILSYLVAILFSVASVASLSNLSNFDDSTPPWSAIVIFLILYGGFSIFLYALKNISNMDISKRDFYNEKADFGNSIALALQSVPRLLSVAFANLLINIPAILIFSYAFYSLLKPISQEELPTASFFIGVALFSIILIIYITVMAVVANMSVNVCVYEKKCFFNALKKAFNLCKNELVRLALVYSAFYLGFVGVFYSIFMSFGIVIGIISGVTGVFDTANVADNQAMMVIFFLFMIIFYILLVLVMLALMPLPAIFAEVIYINQKIKYDGLDLYLAVNDLEKTQARR